MHNYAYCDVCSRHTNLGWTTWLAATCTHWLRDFQSPCLQVLHLFNHADKTMPGRYGRSYVHANPKQRVLRNRPTLSVPLMKCLTHSTIVILSAATCHPVVWLWSWQENSRNTYSSWRGVTLWICLWTTHSVKLHHSSSVARHVRPGCHPPPK
jgi:hypothetical protein